MTRVICCDSLRRVTFPSSLIGSNHMTLGSIIMETRKLCSAYLENARLFYSACVLTAAANVLASMRCSLNVPRTFHPVGSGGLF